MQNPHIIPDEIQSYRAPPPEGVHLHLLPHENVVAIHLYTVVLPMQETEHNQPQYPHMHGD